MEQATRARRWRRRSTAVAVLSVALAATACNGPTWGIRASYRDYVTSGVAGGQITTSQGASWLNGPTSGKGPFGWTVDFASFDPGTGPGTESGVVQFKGTVSTVGHSTPDGWIMDTTFSNPRLELTGDSGTLYVDLNYRPNVSPPPPTLPTLKAATDVPFATVDLSAVDFTPKADGSIAINQAPLTGITAAMQLIGWDAFYGDPVTLDPLTVSFKPKAETLAPEPKITVSKTTGLEPGDQITVWGQGFDPNANTGTRPPLSGQKSGVYAIFGKFTSTWKPSTGAASSNRTVIDQKWALPAASRALMDPTGTSPSFVTIDAFGRFEAVVTVAEHANAGNYGVYVYPGSGAVNAAQEVEQLVTLDVPVPI